MSKLSEPTGSPAEGTRRPILGPAPIPSRKRCIRSEDLGGVSRELGVTVVTLNAWRYSRTRWT